MADEYIDKPEYTIPETSHHPAADDAMAWLVQFKLTKPVEYATILESIYSTALSGNPMANYCVGTLERINHKQGVSDRYLLGLVWLIRDMANGREI